MSSVGKSNMQDIQEGVYPEEKKKSVDDQFPEVKYRLETYNVMDNSEYPASESRICRIYRRVFILKKRRRVLMTSFPKSSIGQKRIVGLKN
jgi:hypothetical protein